MRGNLPALRFAMALTLGLAAGASGRASAQPVGLVSGPEYPPYADAKLPNGGMLTEMTVAAFAAAGMPTTPVTFEPWKRGYAQVQTLRTDATFPYVRTADREQEMLYSDSMFDIDTVAVFAAGSQRDYTGPDSVRGLSICVPLGYAVDMTVEPMARSGDLKVVQNSDVEGCMRQVAAGRVDLFISSTLLVNHLIHRGLDASRYRFGSTPVRRATLHLIVSRTNPRAAAIVEGFNRGLRALRDTGMWSDIVDRHLARMG